MMKLKKKKMMKKQKMNLTHQKKKNFIDENITKEENESLNQNPNNFNELKNNLTSNSEKNQPINNTTNEKKTIEEQIIKNEENEKEDSLLNIIEKKKIHKRNSSKPKLKVNYSIEKKYNIEGINNEENNEYNSKSIKRINTNPQSYLDLLNENDSYIQNKNNETFQDNEKSISINISKRKIKNDYNNESIPIENNNNNDNIT